MSRAVFNEALDLRDLVRLAVPTIMKTLHMDGVPALARGWTIPLAARKLV